MEWRLLSCSLVAVREVSSVVNSYVLFSFSIEFNSPRQIKQIRCKARTYLPIYFCVYHKRLGAYGMEIVSKNMHICKQLQLYKCRLFLKFSPLLFIDGNCSLGCRWSHICVLLGSQSFPPYFFKYTLSYFSFIFYLFTGMQMLLKEYYFLSS